MSLESIINISLGNEDIDKQDLTEERIDAVIDDVRNLISFYREYPDLFVDYLVSLDPDCNFHFFFYQRIFLRVAIRHKFMYATFPRAFSKSFLSMLILMLRCILYPGAELFVTTGGKEQAASITIAKIEEICRLIPPLANEINWTRGISTKGKDNVKYVFKNKSSIDILAARESSRGQRRTGGLMEECVLIDQTALNEIIIPTTNVNRLLPDGTRHSKETTNKSQIYITTAGWKNSFAYDKLIELFIQSLVDPDLVMIIGGTYETPVVEGLLDEDFVDQLKLQGTFNEDSFDREYRSIWTGDVNNAFYSSEKFDKHRILLQPEYEKSGRSSKNAFYVFGIDVGRTGCTTEVCVFKVTPQVQGSALKSLVNLYTWDAEHFGVQALSIKKLYYKYLPKMIAIDANGIGSGLVDFMVIGQEDPETGDYYPPFGVVEGTFDNWQTQYKKFKTNDTVDCMYLIKANAPINTEAYSYAQTQMSSGKIKLLIDEAQAKTKLMATKVGQEMKSEQRNDYLKPFVLTTILREQMLNMVQENEGVNIILKPDNTKILHDKFSAFIYGLYYIKQYEDSKKKRVGRRMSEFLMFS